MIKKIIASLKDAVYTVLVAPTKQLPAMVRRGGKAEPYSFQGLSLVISVLLLAFGSEIKANLEEWAYMAIFISAIWSVLGTLFLIAKETKGMFWYYGQVQGYINAYVEDGMAVPQYYLDDLKRIS